MDIRKLSPELARKAQEELGENPDRLQKDINELRSWLETQPHLISRKDDQFLVTFLRRCNFNLDETKKRIDAFLTCKSSYPELFKTRAVEPSILDILKCGMINIPPNPLPVNGRRLLVTQLSKFDTKKHNLSEVMKARFMLIDILAFTDDTTSINGLELVFDLKNCSLQQALYLNPSVLKKTSAYQEQCVPLRVKGFHVINMRKELQGIIKLARSIVSPAKGEFEMIVHEKESDLYKHIPQEAMPVEYGGHNGSGEKFIEEWENILLDHVKYFEEDSLLGNTQKDNAESCCIS